MKLKTPRAKYIIRFRRQWIWKRSEHYSFFGPFVLERRRRG